MSSVVSGEVVGLGATRDQPNESKAVWSRSFIELLLTQFVFGLAHSVYYLLPKYLRLTFHATASQIGLVMGTGLFAAVLSTPFAAAWLLRGARRNPARVALLSLAASAIAFTQVRQIGPLLYACRILQGIAFTLFVSAAVSRSAELVPKSRLAQAMGWTGLASLVTNALAPFIAEPIAAIYGWKWVFALSAGCALFAVVMASSLEDCRVSSASTSFRLAELIDPRILLAFYATIICGVALGVLFTFTQPLLLERGAKDVGRYFLGYVVGASTVRLLLSRLADRYGRSRVSAVVLLYYSVVLVVTVQITEATQFAFGIGFGVAHGLLYPALNAMALEHVTERGRGVVATLLGGTFSLGYAAALFGLGVVADEWGYRTVFFGTALLVLTGAIAVFSAKPYEPRG